MIVLNMPTEQDALVVTGTVKPEWIDFNGHMNVAYYLLAFDLAIDSLWHAVGLTQEYIATARRSTFAVDTHLTYQQELKQGDVYRIVTTLLAVDDKRLHKFQYMYHAEEGYVAATGEWLSLHVNLETRRVCPWPNDILASFKRIAKAQSDVGIPVETGKTIRVRQPLFALAGYASDEEQ